MSTTQDDQPDLPARMERYLVKDTWLWWFPLCTDSRSTDSHRTGSRRSILGRLSKTIQNDRAID